MSLLRPTIVLLVLLLFGNLSLVAAEMLGSITFKRFAFLWFLGGLSDCLAALVSAIYAWKYRGNRLVIYYTMAVGAIALEGICVLIASLAQPDVKHYPLWYACWFWTGRWTRCFAVWMLLLFQLGTLNGKSKSKQESEIV